MKSFYWGLFFVSLFSDAQTIERQTIDIIYGNQVIRTKHQVVISSPEEVSVIPVDQVESALGPNIVITADGSKLSAFEENSIAEREQAIFDEVNKRTEEAPFTVLFTGNIPEKIQEKRLRMMPKIDLLGGPSNVNEKDVAKPDVGDFSPVGKGGVPIEASSTASDAKLEKLIGGG